MTRTQSVPLLVLPNELARHLHDEDWVVVDCRFNLLRPQAGEDAWREGHVPGARYAHLDRDLASPITPSSGRHPLPRSESLVELFSSWGIRDGSRVVAYDDAGGAVAARLWWLLRWMGHQQASLLDGGWQAWQAAGLPVSDAPPVTRRESFSGSPGQMPTVSTSDVANRRGDPAFQLLDVRAPARYAGAEEPIDPVAGHVPGAINAPFQGSLAAGGRFRAPEELAKALGSIVRDPGRAAVMCGSGVTACHGIFSLELAGLPGAALYPGSWSEWIRSPDRAIAVGEAP